ncbi:glutathione S-transferase C-terminal domain-containing protein [uncultured Leclercia sp.]|uniref:glutathione S-transferase C-terminal domain-containing protein n=1 Tax=uncultured Leclercia sp. TaxID=332959 RepID=UPI0025953566|nr:glutathione S-transferase C-terminal domain-containing protein [uncultured Leclercia sp.]
MGVLENGVWKADKDAEELAREDVLTRDIKPASGRYHLYVSQACPFAHRPWLVISMLGLENSISVSSVAPRRYDRGWEFSPDYPDPLGISETLAGIYTRSRKDYSGRVTVPVFWDRKHGTIASSDSASLAEELASNWLTLADRPITLIPEALRENIMSLNRWLHENLNRRVYQVGFAVTQDGYDAENAVLFNALGNLEKRLTGVKYLHGSALTLSDLFLLPSLVRFEAVYAIHFKANTQALSEFTSLYSYMLRMLDLPGVRETLNLPHIKEHYYFSHRHLNPAGIIPAGPNLPWYNGPNI